MENKIDFKIPLIKSILWGLLIAGLSYSCSVSKAGISRVLPVVKLYRDTPTSVTEVSKKIAFNQPSRKDSIVSPSTYILKDLDTTNYNRMILENQKIGLMNDARMLDILSSQSKEILSLKHEKSTLQRKATISEGEKENAYTWKVFQKTIDYILYLGIGSFLILIFGIIYLIYTCRKITIPKEWNKTISL